MKKLNQSKEKSFLNSLLFLLLLLLTIPPIGVAGDEAYSKFPMPSKFVPAIQENGSPRYITAEQIEIELRKHSKEFKQLYWNKKIKQYIIPHHDWLVDLLDSYGALLKRTKVKAKADTWDCENYSALLNALTTVSIWKAGYYETRAAFGWMRVDAKNEWAGLPGVMHALMFGVTDKGLFVIEPQNGHRIKLEDYPNRQFIQEVFLF